MPQIVDPRPPHFDHIIWDPYDPRAHELIHKRVRQADSLNDLFLNEPEILQDIDPADDYPFRFEGTCATFILDPSTPVRMTRAQLIDRIGYNFEIID